MNEKEFIPKKGYDLPKNGKVTWKAPSNIALIKYWGKKPHQIPANPSISFTLDACATTTTLSFDKRQNASETFSFDFFFEGPDSYREEKESFKPKIITFFERIEPYLPFLKQYHLVIETSNTFPHSSGIASSASGMAALALCLLSIEKKGNTAMTEDFFRRKASFLARLGSGSACRSIEGEVIQWGETPSISGSSDLYGIKYPFEIHQNFKNFHDTILLVHKGQKQVSSSVGHDLMHGHPFAEQRFQQAHDNIENLKEIFSEGNLDAFIEIVEHEALTLHAMMMTSTPYFVLMKPNTLEIINKIWEFRKTSGLRVCFTLDAGANVHVLYPESEKKPVYKFIQETLLQYCENAHHICDRIGFGAKKW